MSMPPNYAYATAHCLSRRSFCGSSFCKLLIVRLTLAQVKAACPHITISNWGVFFPLPDLSGSRFDEGKARGRLASGDRLWEL
jgi:hypothetical protein